MAALLSLNSSPAAGAAKPAQTLPVMTLVKRSSQLRPGARRRPTSEPSTPAASGLVASFCGSMSIGLAHFVFIAGGT